LLASPALPSCRLPFSTTQGDGNTDATSHKNDNHKTYLSQMKNPIVHQLWMAREQAKELRKNLQTVEDEKELPRPPSKSQTNISYPFSKDDFLKEQYRNPWGQMRFGKMLEDLDALAGNIAFAHVQDPTMNIVTASVDRIQIHSPPNLEADQHLEGKVTFVGKSSMEIRMSCQTDEGEWMVAYFTFVATDPQTHRSVLIPPLAPETPLEHAQYAAGARRAAQKKELRQRQKNHSSGGMGGDSILEQQAQALMNEAGALLNMPSLADPHSILMTATKMQNAEVAQPQLRNLANRIFGGFLMRRAFELAYATCYVFGGARPRFIELDEVSFQSPVEVGDLTVFNSRVLYTAIRKGDDIDYDLVNKTGGHIPLVTIQVEAWIVVPERASASLSNSFYFTFVLPDQTPVRRILPSNIDEARRMVQRMAADERQRDEDKQEHA
jgi:acyl-coenzyme A thioesterase 9